MVRLWVSSHHHLIDQLDMTINVFFWIGVNKFQAYSYRITFIDYGDVVFSQDIETWGGWRERHWLRVSKADYFADDILNFWNFSLSCPFLGAQSIDFFAYKMPIIFLLGVNTFFLVWIMVVCKIFLLADKCKLNIENVFFRLFSRNYALK